MTYFAESLKKLRQENNMSMQELADKAGISKSMVCKVERDEVQPTLDVAARLSNAFGKPLSEMLHTPQTTQVVFLPKKEQAVWEDASHIKRRNISPIFEGLKIEWLHVELPPHTTVSKVTACTRGVEKYMLMIKGSLEMKINNEFFSLKKGDSLYFNALLPHEISNPSKDPVEYYLVMKHE
jgi:transcriptional regulator with XRE-family HTH domain